jgi:hypothetical protein
LDLWETVYPDALLIALTDTFSSESFFKAWLLLYADGLISITTSKLRILLPIRTALVGGQAYAKTLEILSFSAPVQRRFIRNWESITEKRSSSTPMH